MKSKRKNGFTLVELTVVLVIFAIIMAIASPFFIRYWRAAEFRKNESNARTVYLAAESKQSSHGTAHPVVGKVQERDKRKGDHRRIPE